MIENLRIALDLLGQLKDLLSHMPVSADRVEIRERIEELEEIVSQSLKWREQQALRTQNVFLLEATK